MSVKISQLPAATSVTSDDLIPIVDSGSLATQRATAGQLLQFVTGSTFNTLSVTNLTASASGSFTGDGSGLINLNISSSTSGNITGSGNLSNPITLKDDIVLNSVTANILSGTEISGANALISGDVLIYGSASFTQDPDFAYVVYDSGSDKIVIFPGLKVSGSTVVSGNLDVTGTISASNYLGLPTSSVELPKLIVSSSVSLLTTQRAVFAKNSDSSSISITLPSASLADSREYYVIKSDSVTGSVNILPSSPNLINGTSSFELNGPFQSVTLIHDGTDWYVF
jgi:hypothetical protein